MLIVNTPFSPEPLTEMEREPANIEVDWRGILLRKDLVTLIDEPHINAWCLPQIPGPVTLIRRVAVNRGGDVDTLRRLSMARDIDEAASIAGHLAARNAGRYVSDVLTTE